MHEVVLRRRLGGHFVAEVKVNGSPTPMLVDTGASVITLTREDAARAGIDLDSLSYTARVTTANGVSMAAPVRLDEVSVGGIGFTNLRALVAAPGRLNESLLGINFLSRLTSYEVRGDSLILRVPAS
jgi:aspartyl protease family protein